MGTILRRLCAAAVLFAAALHLAPEGGAKRIGTMAASCALVLMLLSGLGRSALPELGTALAEAREAAAHITTDADGIRQRMVSRVIERECEEYIWDKADELGVPLTAVAVSARWSGEGLWVPHSVKLTVREQGRAASRLSELLQSELGVAREEQTWEISAS